MSNELENKTTDLQSVVKSIESNNTTTQTQAGVLSNTSRTTTTKKLNTPNLPTHKTLYDKIGVKYSGKTPITFTGDYIIVNGIVIGKLTKTKTGYLDTRINGKTSINAYATQLRAGQDCLYSVCKANLLGDYDIIDLKAIKVDNTNAPLSHSQYGIKKANDTKPVKVKTQAKQKTEIKQIA
jgi:hypothetical protein